MKRWAQLTAWYQLTLTPRAEAVSGKVLRLNVTKKGGSWFGRGTQGSRLLGSQKIWAGAKTGELSIKCGMSQAICYKWRA